MTASLPRCLAAELAGTGPLVSTVVGSGVAVSRLSPADDGLHRRDGSGLAGRPVSAFAPAGAAGGVAGAALADVRYGLPAVSWCRTDRSGTGPPTDLGEPLDHPVDVDIQDRP